MKMSLPFSTAWLFAGALVLGLSAASCGDGSGSSTGGTGGTTVTGGTGGTTTGGTGGTGGTTTGGTGGTSTGGTGGAASLCTTSGGTEGTAMCCTMTGDYPDGCATGPCGCAPADSHEVKVCVCPDTQCFDPTVGCRTL